MSELHSITAVRTCSLIRQESRCTQELSQTTQKEHDSITTVNISIVTQKYVGKIGTNTMIGNDSQRGLVFDIEYDTAYMSWANKESANGSSYMMKWAYCTQQCNNYEANMLHAGADINMHYYKLRNVSFEDGAINGTLTFKQPLVVNSDGTLSKWSTATLTFKNGILISGAWSNG